MTFAARVRAGLYAREIRERADSYAASSAPGERAAEQLRLLNLEWSRLLATVPYVKGLHADGRVPTMFSTLEQFSATVPVTTREVIRRHRQSLVSAGRPAEFVRMTGGSTAEPVQLPAWRSETAFTRADMWLGRSWYGVTPSSRLFLLWGHAHLLGSGLRGWLRARRQSVSDRLLGYLRFSAYDLREERLREAARAMLRFRPDYVVGYSVALDLFARANEDLGAELGRLGLKVVVGTAEAFPSEDCARRLEALFGCPVGMEYGAVETGLVAHTRPAGGYFVFWRSYLVEAVPDDAGPRVVVTSLYPRCFPLIRYDLGDSIEPADADGSGGPALADFRRVLGRCNEFIVLRDGAVIHSEVFSHAVRPCARISAFQVVQSDEGLLLLYVAGEALPEADSRDIRDRLGRVHRDLAGVEIRRCEALRRTVAGKTPMIIRRATPAGAPPADRKTSRS